MADDTLIQWFAQYAYQPGVVYSAIVVLMVASSFGLPAPEEITLLSAGLVCYMGSRPDLFPPPYPGAIAVNTTVTACTAFFAVFLSDFLVFSLGKHFGARFLRIKYMERYRDKMNRISRWTIRYGSLAAGIFRFTPGLRFPGHFACGMLGLAPLTFAVVDGLAALVSVPTQVFLIAFFGEHILVYLKQFKLVILGLLILALAVVIARRYWRPRETPGGAHD